MHKIFKQVKSETQKINKEQAFQMINLKKFKKRKVNKH